MHITIDEVNAWIQDTKLVQSSVDVDLESQVVVLIFARLYNSFNVASWVDVTTTPKLIRTILSMHYTAWLYDRAYSDDADEVSNYATLLRRMADDNIAGLIAGNIVLEEEPTELIGTSSPSFFPNDLSSANEPTVDNPSDGPPVFMMGTVF